MRMALATVGAVIAMAVTAVVAADTYPSTWDNIDLDKVLANDRLVVAYVNCLLDRGPCTADAAALKKIFPEALKTSCSKCTKKQKDKGAQAVKFMMEKKPDLWKQLTNKYDPDGAFTKHFST